MMQITRSQWTYALTALPAKELIECVAELTRDWQIAPRAMPQAGLGLLQLKDTVMQQAFYLGEFPIATAWLEVISPDGQRAEGAAQVMDDNLALAEALALCDAMLAARLPGHEQLEQLLQRGLTRREADAQLRKQMLAHTQVDFSLLDDASPE